MPFPPTSLYPVLLASTAASALLLLYHHLSQPYAFTPPSAISPLSARLPRSSLSSPSSPSPSLPYPPDALPGARDVDSPYGWMRVYEWGPEDGRKVLLVHGISTPCIALADVAWRLVERGCRVCLFGLASRAPPSTARRTVDADTLLRRPDLWGRGWSDTPTDLPHDARLYASQILIALATSPLTWTGARSAGGGFALLGYSLGGGIAMSFAASFPALITSVVLLAPTGVLRAVHADYENPLLQYHWLFPQRWLRWQVRRILCGDRLPAVGREGEGPDGKVLGKQDAEARLAKRMAPRAPSASPAAPSRVDIAGVIAWQVEHNEGFVRSFVSALRNAPTAKQEASWRKVGENLTRAREDAASEGACCKVLIVAGESDPFIIKDELIEDATMLLGAENVEVRVIDDGHEFPINRAEELVEYISTFWDLKQSD
ncbi:hypothetical protein MMC26_007813 [Xylographa opegraphella]|nr:hypothetical protein [Xylographa opegraphella]